MLSDRDISVVIGFKDWGRRRLCLAVRSIIGAMGELDGEVIVSDYGSRDPGGTQQAVESLGARYVYTETDGIWSRSRALNAGFAESSGSVLVATDADMIFSPGSLSLVGERILADPDLGLLLQCRDLPRRWSDKEIESHGLDWSAFDRDGRRRPRWGMGGMMAVSRNVFLKIRGYDERMHTYGGEDIDFAYRVRRAGARLQWVEADDVRMYHMWHPPTAETHSRSTEDSLAVENNKRIMRDDKTFVRNVLHWEHRPADAPPLVSVVISTHNRSNLLVQAIQSVQAQTVQDFEIVVVDDGSTDDTRSVVAALHDPRIRYFWQENRGVAAARNRGVDESGGLYVAVLDDDDIALPWRLEAQFAALTEGVSATFGSFVNFDDESGEMALYRTKIFNDAVSADKGGAPGHSTWMVARDFMAAIRYDEALSSAVDNNFALRAVRSGLVWNHSGAVHTLRRMHSQQITALDSEQQLAGARGAYDYFTFIAQPWTLAKLRKGRGKDDYVPMSGGDIESLLPYLPDHLVTRSLTAETIDGRQGYQCTMPNGDFLKVESTHDLKWSDLSRFGGRVNLSGLTATRGLDEPATEDGGIQAVVAVLRSRFAEQRNGLGLQIEFLREGEVCLPEPASRAVDVVPIRLGDETWSWGVGFFEKTGQLLEAVEALDDVEGVEASGPEREIFAAAMKLLRRGTKDVVA